MTDNVMPEGYDGKNGVGLIWFLLYVSVSVFVSGMLFVVVGSLASILNIPEIPISYDTTDVEMPHNWQYLSAMGMVAVGYSVLPVIGFGLIYRNFKPKWEIFRLRHLWQKFNLPAFIVGLLISLTIIVVGFLERAGYIDWWD